MNPHSGMNDNYKKDRTKATVALPMAGAIVTAALLLSGVFLISSYQQPAIAQEQNMTEGGGGILEGGNATDATGAAGGNQSEVRTNLEQARMALQNNDTQGAMMYLDMALSALGGGAAGGTQGNTTSNTTVASSNAITTGSQNGIPPVGGTGATDVDDEITEEEEDDSAADGNNNNNDDDADDRSSNTEANSPETGTEEEDNSECGGITVGGTSAADDYGCAPDPDY
jgi:hypothetical protein